MKKIVFDKLWALLKERKLGRLNTFKEVGLSSQTLNKMGHNECVSLKTIDKLCDYLHCQPCDIMELK